MKSEISCFDTVSFKFVKKSCPSTYNAWRKALSAQTDLESFAESMTPDGDFFQIFSPGTHGCCGPDEDEESRVDKLITSWENLQKDFKKKTGLSLQIGVMEIDESCVLSDIDGAFFYVDDAYKMTVAGKANKRNIMRKFYSDVRNDHKEILEKILDTKPVLPVLLGIDKDLDDLLKNRLKKG